MNRFWSPCHRYAIVTESAIRQRIIMDSTSNIQLPTSNIPRPSTVFMGTPEFAVPSLAALVNAGYDVVGVYTRPDQPAGRGQKLTESPVKAAARGYGLPIFQPATLRAAAAQAALAALAPELIVVAAYGLILPQAVLDLPRFGCVNVHGSLLPRHRGAAPIAAAILAGDAETGVSIMLMDAGVDTGPVLSTAALPVAPDDTTGTLTPKLAALGADLLTATLPRWLRGEITPQPQPTEGATLAPRLAKEAGAIDWREPVWLIERRVRAYQPWPGAYTTWRGQMLKVLRAEVGGQGAGGRRQEAGGRGQESGVRSQGEVNGNPRQPAEVGFAEIAAVSTTGPSFAESHPPGTVVAGPGGRAGVATGEGILWLVEVQLAGRRALPAAAFVAGARGFIGSRLGA